MKKRLIAIANLMFCLAVGTVVSYADAPDDEKGQVVVGESVTDEDIGYVQKQEQITANDGLQEQETVQVDKAAITGKVTIEDIDETDGTFSIILSDLQNKEKISQVLMAVWCDTNGQDDLQWFIATKNDKNQYVVRDSVANHKYQLEKYNVGVYAINTDGMQIGIAGTSFEFEKKDVETEIKQNAKDRLQIDINVDNVRIPGGIKNVLIPVWSDINGQDDLIWYTSKKLDENHYSLTVDIRNHKGLGKYNVHVYGETKTGNLIKLGMSEFFVNNPEIGTIKVEDKNQESGTFLIRLSDIKNAEYIDNIMVPVWSDVNGQDDLVWYTAKKMSDSDEYVVDVNIKKHKYSLGKYNVGVYITDVTGRQYGVSSLETEMMLRQGSIDIKEKDGLNYLVTIKDFEVPGGATSVLVPIWSEVNGQDDLIWYTAKKNAKDQYEINLDVSKHKGLGKYWINAYAVQPNGNLMGLGNTNISVESPALGKMQVESDKESGKLKITVPVNKNAGLIKNVLIPIWSDKNQGNLVWYTAKKNAKNEYVVETNIKNHKYHSGIYWIDVYMTDITGMLTGVEGTQCDMSPDYDNLTAKDIDGSESVYQLNLNNLKVPGGEKGVLFAVWGNAGGQNDLRWYTAENLGKHNYGLKVSITNHKELGAYNVNAYYITRNNELQGIASTTFNVSQATKCAGIQVSEVNGNKGTFKVTVSGVFAPSSVQTVQIPMWCADNQSDIVWYTAIKEAEGIYSAIMNVKNHAYHFGNYKINVYATMGNGIFSGVGGTSQIINAENYIYNRYVSGTQREIWLLGADGEQVLFPTWSETNGQDDIVWYSGVNRGNGTWSVTVDSNNHKHGGKYNTHAYVAKNGVRSAVGSTSYSLERIQTAQQFMNAKANMYSSRTPYLLLVNRSTHKVGIYQGWQGNWRCIQYWDCSDGAPSTPTVEGTFQVGSKGYYFDSGSARCYWYTQFRGNYLFHSVLYNKNGTLMDGRLGMPLSHGCVRLNINNAKWIYDTIPAGSTVVVYH